MLVCVNEPHRQKYLRSSILFSATNVQNRSEEQPIKTTR